MSPHKANIHNARRCRLGNTHRRQKNHASHKNSGSLQVTPYEIIISWLFIRYGISEFEFLFGSKDFLLQRRILVARAYIKNAFDESSVPTKSDLEEAFDEAAVEAFLNAHGVDRAEYDDAATEGVKRAFRKSASEYFYEGVPIAQKEGDDLSLRAKKALDNLTLSDLRRGTTEERNAKRSLILQAILKNIAAPKDQKKAIIRLAREHGIHRETMSKYYRAVESMLRLGLPILSNAFDEKKRGKKANPFAVISENAYQALLIALETTPDQYGLEFTSWSCAAIQDFFEGWFQIEVDREYLYHFLHAHDIVSKSASRKNPKADPEKVRKFKAELFSKLLSAIKNNEVVVFLDETHIQQGNHQRGYAKKGKEAYYSTNGATLHCHGSLITIIGFDFVLIKRIMGTVKSAVYIETLELLRTKYPTTKFLIFRDNATIHRSKLLQTWMQESGADKFLRFESIPPYCPELNPVELFNNEYKGYLKKSLCRNEKDVLNATEAFINSYQMAEGEPLTVGKRKARHFFKGTHTQFIYADYVSALRTVCKERRVARQLAKRDAAA